MKSWTVQPIATRGKGLHRAEYALYDENGYHVASTFGPEAKRRATLLAESRSLHDALAGLLKAFDAFTKEANWGASALSADTIRLANEAPNAARAVLGRIGKR